MADAVDSILENNTQELTSFSKNLTRDDTQGIVLEFAGKKSSVKGRQDVEALNENNSDWFCHCQAQNEEWK